MVHLPSEGEAIARAVEEGRATYRSIPKGCASKKERCNVKRRGWRCGLRSYPFKHSISKIRFNACGAKPTKLDHEATDIHADIISFSL